MHGGQEPELPDRRRVGATKGDPASDVTAKRNIYLAPPPGCPNIVGALLTN